MILPDLLSKHLVLVVCGTGAGQRSAELGRYYAGQGNRFWRTLFEVGLTPIELEPAQAEHLLTLGIGLTDVVKDAAGSDVDLSFAITDIMTLRMKILSYQPWYLCFNGKRAAQVFLRTSHVEYGVHGRLGRTTLFVAPSTSRAANGAWAIAPWQDLSRRVRRRRGAKRASGHGK